MTTGDGLAILGGCLVMAAALIAAAWCSVNDRRERLRAVERLSVKPEATAIMRKRVAR